MERAVITTKNRLAIRGQIIGGLLGAIGLIGSLIVAGQGHGWAGFGIALTSLVSLVSVFVIGREEQRRERAEKAALRERIRRGDPIEEVENEGAPGGETPARRKGNRTAGRHDKGDKPQHPK